MKIKIIHEDCDPSLSKDTSLPYTAYLIEYTVDGLTKFDIVVSSKKVDIFDHYWDHYRYDFINMRQTEGRINPKLWNDPNEQKKKKK